MVVATLVVAFMCADIGLAYTPQLGSVQFINSQNYPGISPGPYINGWPTYQGHRLWYYPAEARHWDSRGKLWTQWFRHQGGGPERILFYYQLSGNSNGKERESLAKKGVIFIFGYIDYGHLRNICDHIPLYS